MTKLVYLFVVFLLIVLSFLIDDIFLLFANCLFVVLVSFLYKKEDIFSPILWFTPFIIIYHFSAVFSAHYNILYIKNPIEVSQCTSIAVSSFAFFTVLFEKSVNIVNRKFDLLFNFKKFYIYNRIILFVFGVCFLNMLLFFNSGISSKADAAVAGVSGGLSGYLNRVLILLLIVLFVEMQSNNLKWNKKMIFYAIYFLLQVFITGERDYLFIYLIAILFLKFHFGSINFKKLCIISFSFLLFIPILGEMKNLFKKDNIAEEGGLNILERTFFTGEFISGGRNLDTVISFEHTPERITYFDDFFRVIIPGFIYNSSNGVSWFAQTYHSERFLKGEGLGFSLIAEAYVNGGKLGIVFLFAAISVFIMFFYKNYKGSKFIFVGYLFLISFSIYALRGDVSTLLSPMLKQVLIPLFLIKLFFYERKKTISNM